MAKEFLISVVIYFVYVFFKSIDSMHMLQQNKYNRKKTYLKWLNKNKEKLFKDYSILFVILIVFAFINSNLLLILTFNLLYVFLLINLISERKKSQNKLPLKYTARVKRLIFTNTLISLMIVIIMSFFINETNLVYCYLILGLFAYFNKLYILIAL